MMSRELKGVMCPICLEELNPKDPFGGKLMDLTENQRNKAFV